MNCIRIDPGNPFLWLTLCGLVFGGAFSFLLAPRRRRSPAFFLVLVSVSILLGLLFFFTSDFSLKDQKLEAYWAAASVLIGYCMLSFRKSAGLALLIAAVLFSGIVYYAFSGWKSVACEPDVVHFSVLSVAGDYFRLEYTSSDGDDMQQKLPAKAVRPDIEIISIPRYFFLLKGNTFYHFQGFISDASGDGIGISEGKILSLLVQLPGFSISLLDTEAVIPNPAVQYLYTFNAEGQLVLSRLI